MHEEAACICCTWAGRGSHTEGTGMHQRALDTCGVRVAERMCSDEFHITEVE